MRTTRTLIALGAASAVAAAALAAAAPAAPAAASADALRAPLASEPTLRAQMRGHQHRLLLARYRSVADAPSPGATTWSNGRLTQAISAAKAQRAERKAEREFRPTGTFAAIAQCESGGNPRAIGGGGTFRGLYQFDVGTWQSVGGTGDPAAASPAEQTRRAQILYARSGSSPWPVCGR